MTRVGDLLVGPGGASPGLRPEALAVVDRAFGPEGRDGRGRRIEASSDVSDERGSTMSSSLIWTAVGLALAVFWAIIFPALKRRFGERIR